MQFWHLSICCVLSTRRKVTTKFSQEATSNYPTRTNWSRNYRLFILSFILRGRKTFIPHPSADYTQKGVCSLGGRVDDGGEPLPGHGHHGPDGPVEGDLHPGHQVGEQAGRHMLKCFKCRYGGGRLQIVDWLIVLKWLDWFQTIRMNFWFIKSTSIPSSSVYVDLDNNIW